MKKLNKATLTLVTTLALSPMTYATASDKQECKSMEHCCAHAKMDSHASHKSKKQKKSSKSDWRDNRPMVGEHRAL